MQDWTVILTEEALVLSFLFLVGLLAYIISTIGAGGGALMTIPAVTFLLTSSIAAPVVNMGAFIGRPSRLWIFRKHIDWSIVLYYIPAAASGSLLAAWLFESSPTDWLQIIVGLFLISTVVQYKFGKKRRSFKVKKWYFLPIGFVVSLVGTFTGGMGPVQNPFYLNLNISKEMMIGTKAANSFFMGIFQLIGYAGIGILSPRIMLFGVCLGLGATLGNIVGKNILLRISEKVFLKIVLLIMVVSGISLILKVAVY